MSRILLDQNMPIGLRHALPDHQLPDHQIVTSYEIGWSALENGKVLAAGKAAGFDNILTGDQNITQQQNLTAMRLALVVLSTNHWPTIRTNIEIVRHAVENAQPASCVVVNLDRPVGRRTRGHTLGDS